MIRLPRRLVLWGGAAAIAAGGFAFMATNTFAGVTPGAGSGSTTVSGYIIHTTSFTACGKGTTATNPEYVCYAHFWVQPSTTTEDTAGTAWVQFSYTGSTTPSGTVYACKATTTYKSFTTTPATRKGRFFVCDLRSSSGTPPHTGGVNSTPITDIQVTAIDMKK